MRQHLRATKKTFLLYARGTEEDEHFENRACLTKKHFENRVIKTIFASDNKHFAKNDLQEENL